MSTSTAIAKDTLASQLDLWAMAYYFRANWTNNLTVRSSFQTDVKFSFSAAEQRRGLRATPFRTVSATLCASGRKEVFRLRMLLQRMSISHNLFPLFSEIVTTTAAISIGGTTITCPTTNRRFSAGMRVLIALASEQGAPDVFETAIVTGTTSTTLTISAGTANAYPVGSVVIPLMECLPLLSSQIQAMTDAYASIQITMIERTGATQVPPFASIGDAPSGFVTYGGIPLFHPKPDWSQPINLSLTRYGQLNAQGLSQLPELYGFRANFGFQGNFAADDRATALKLISFFESRGGMLLPFYVINPITEFDVISISSTTIVVKGYVDDFDLTFQPCVCFELADGTQNMATVASHSGSVVSGQPISTIVLTAAIAGMTTGNLVAMRAAFLVRFASDELEETWHTDSVMTCGMSFIEVANEKSVTLSNITNITTTGTPPVGDTGNFFPLTIRVTVDTSENPGLYPGDFFNFVISIFGPAVSDADDGVSAGGSYSFAGGGTFLGSGYIPGSDYYRWTWQGPTGHDASLTLFAYPGTYNFFATFYGDAGADTSASSTHLGTGFPPLLPLFGELLYYDPHVVSAPTGPNGWLTAKPAYDRQATYYLFEFDLLTFGGPIIAPNI